MYGAHFRKQYALGPFIVDFCCCEEKLIVEVDGDTHGERQQYDERRTRWLEEQRVIE